MRAHTRKELEQYLDEDASKKMLKEAVLPLQFTRHCKVNLVRLSELGFNLYIPTKDDFNSKFYKWDGGKCVKQDSSRRSSHMLMPSRLVKELVSGYILNATGKILMTEPYLYGDTDYYLALLARNCPLEYDRLTLRRPAMDILVQMGRSDGRYARLRGNLSNDFMILSRRISSLYLMLKDIGTRRKLMEIIGMKLLRLYSRAVADASDGDALLGELVLQLNKARRDVVVQGNHSPKEAFLEFVRRTLPAQEHSVLRNLQAEPFTPPPPVPNAINAVSEAVGNLFAENNAAFTMFKQEAPVLESPEKLREYVETTRVDKGVLDESDLLHLRQRGMILLVDGENTRLVHVVKRAETICLIRHFSLQAKKVLQQMRDDEKARIAAAKGAWARPVSNVLVDPLVKHTKDVLRATEEQPVIPVDIQREVAEEYMPSMSIQDTVELSRTLQAKSTNHGKLAEFVHDQAVSTLDAEIQSKNILMVAFSRAKRDGVRIFPTFDDVRKCVTSLLQELMQPRVLRYQILLETKEVLVNHTDLSNRIKVTTGEVAGLRQLADKLEAVYVSALLGYVVEYCGELLKSGVGSRVLNQKLRDEAQLILVSPKTHKEKMALVDIFTQAELPAIQLSLVAQKTSQSASGAANFELKIEEEKRLSRDLHSNMMTEMKQACEAANVRAITSSCTKMAVSVRLDKGTYVGAIGGLLKWIDDMKTNLFAEWLGHLCLGAVRFGVSETSLLSACVLMRLTSGVVTDIEGEIDTKYLTDVLPKRLLNVLTMACCISCSQALLKSEHDATRRVAITERLLMMCYAVTHNRLAACDKEKRIELCNRLFEYVAALIPNDVGCLGGHAPEAVSSQQIEQNLKAMCKIRYGDADWRPSFEELMTIELVDDKRMSDEFSTPYYNQPLHEIADGDRNRIGWNAVLGEPFNFEPLDAKNFANRVECYSCSIWSKRRRKAQHVNRDGQMMRIPYSLCCR